MKTNLQMNCPHCGKQINLQKEKGFTFLLQENREEIKEAIEQEYFFKLKEKEKIVDDLKIKLDEARQRIENHSHSQQLSGETMELALEEMLRRTHPTDEIIEVKKGQLGADCIQLVKTKDDIQIGKIIYEVKNTQSFSSGWVTKLKKDNLKAKADIMVIVTNTMPKDIKGKFGFVDGIWICHYNSVCDMVMALRFGLLKMQSLSIVQQGKSTKSEMMYDYIVSEEFKNLFESVLSGVAKIRSSHEQEKMKMALLWKEREKSLEQILSNTIEFYGSLKAISGTEIANVPMLDAPQQAD